MALKPGRSILGIELDEREIRVVEIRNRNGESSISTLTALTPPEGYLGENGVRDPEMIGAELKAVLLQAQVKTTDVAFGLPSWCCAMRPLGVPPVAGSELYFIAAGEIEHVQMFREPGASFDLIRLNDSKLLESSGRNYLLIGAEHSVLSSIKAMARAAGLNVIAIEPAHSALYRVAYSQATAPANIFVTLSEFHAEISLLDHGELALHRTFNLGTSIFDTPESEEGGFKPYFDIDAASSLAVELRRSIDFIARELPESPPTEILHLACTHPEAPVLAHWLESALSVDVQVADIRRGGPQLRILKALTENDSNRYVGAYGLALRDPALLPPNTSIVNLLQYENVRDGVRMDGANKFRLALVGAFLLLGVGLVTAIVGTVGAHQAADALLQSQTKLTAKQAEFAAKSLEVQQRSTQLNLLAADGVPARAYIQALTRSLPAKVGLVEVHMNNPVALDLSAEATSETPMIQLEEALRMNPTFQGVSVTWFEQIDPTVPQAGMRFRMSMGAVPPAPGAPTPAIATPPTAGVGAPGAMATGPGAGANSTIPTRPIPGQGAIGGALRQAITPPTIPGSPDPNTAKPNGVKS